MKRNDSVTKKNQNKRQIKSISNKKKRFWQILLLLFMFDHVPMVFLWALYRFCSILYLPLIVVFMMELPAEKRMNCQCQDGKHRKTILSANSRKKLKLKKIYKEIEKFILEEKEESFSSSSLFIRNTKEEDTSYMYYCSL